MLARDFFFFLVLEKLKACGGNFGGEQSGHIIFSDYAKTGDGLIAALQFSALMLSRKKRKCNFRANQALSATFTQS